MSLREAKKVRTREGLAAAAIQMFTERGFAETTVEEIAEAAAVSPRTFFRYFATKEDVVLDVMRSGAPDIGSILQDRPADEPILCALRSAALSWCEVVGGSTPGLACVVQLARSSPQLAHRLEEQKRSHQLHLEAVVGQRLGVDPSVDPRPHLIVSLVGAVLGASIERWADSDGCVALCNSIEAGFDLLQGGMP
jgi:AcrR family transcriptional regulator